MKEFSKGVWVVVEKLRRLRRLARMFADHTDMIKQEKMNNLVEALGGNTHTLSDTNLDAEVINCSLATRVHVGTVPSRHTVGHQLTN